MDEAVFGALPWIPLWLELPAWVAAAAGLQWLTLHHTRAGRKAFRWLTLLPALLALLTAVGALACAYGAVFALGTALEEKNAFIGLLAFLGMVSGPMLSFFLVPRAGLWLAGWTLGWGLDVWIGRLMRKRKGEEDHG